MKAKSWHLGDFTLKIPAALAADLLRAFPKRGDAVAFLGDHAAVDLAAAREALDTLLAGAERAAAQKRTGDLSIEALRQVLADREAEAKKAAK